jgi:hypothetical protein
MRAEARQSLAERRLGGIEPNSRSREAALGEHHLQHTQIAQLQIIRLRHNHHSDLGIAPISDVR